MTFFLTAIAAITGIYLSVWYTAFKSKWQILNLCCLKTTGPNPFKFSVDIGNNWPFCYAKTQISLLNSFGSIKQWKVPYFDGWIFFFPRLIWANLSLSTYKCPRNWATTLGLVSIDRKLFRNYTLARKSKKVSFALRLSLVFDSHCQNQDC